MKRTYRKSTSTHLTCSVFIVCSILPLKIMVNCVFSCFEPGFIVVINTCTGTGAKMVYSLWLQRLFLLFVRYRHVQYNSLNQTIGYIAIRMFYTKSCQKLTLLNVIPRCVINCSNLKNKHTKKKQKKTPQCSEIFKLL